MPAHLKRNLPELFAVCTWLHILWIPLGATANLQKGAKKCLFLGVNRKPLEQHSISRKNGN